MSKNAAICVVKMGSLALPITRYSDGRYYFAYQIGTAPRQKVTCKDLVWIKGEAERILIAMSRGEIEAARLTAQDARIYVAAKQALAESNIDMELDAAARILGQAAKILGCDVDRLVEAARFFHNAQPNRRSGATVPHVLEEFLRTKETELANGDLSDVHVVKLREDLAKFGAAFDRPIAAVETNDIQDWLNAHKVGPRRRRNIRDKIIALFNFARIANYLSGELKTAAEKTKRPKIHKGTEPTFTALEMQVLLDSAPEKLLPYLAIGAFAGVRGSEIARLKWSAIRWEQSVIIVEAEEAGKDGYRRPVQIRPNLMGWLQPFRGRHSGPIIPEGTGRIDNVVRRHANKFGLKWKRNILRSSFGSYLTALTKDIGFVSLQMGNSAAVVRRHYLEAKTEDDAKQYFDVIPPSSAGNVVELPLGVTWNVEKGASQK